jgi:putative aminopeptidase FrvX
LLSFLQDILNTPSPTGYAQAAIARIDRELAAFADLERRTTRKGALVVDWPGQAADQPRAITAHTDTLGAMVKEIKDNGRLKLSRIGGYAWNTVEGEGCTVFASREREGGLRTLRGSILLEKASGHIFGPQVAETARDDETMEVRLDIGTVSDDETRQLGVEVGDYVAIDPRVEVNEGFVRSRHLDDKAGVACLVAAVKAMHDAGEAPARRTLLHFSNYEEVGHGAAAGIPPEVVELVVVDMAAVGEGQTSDEFHATLCAKDSSGPYHYDLNRRLLRLAEAHGIPHRVDIYPYYASDGSAFWRSGGDVALALIGPGIDASHNYERTHLESLLATTRWVLAYLLE